MTEKTIFTEKDDAEILRLFKIYRCGWTKIAEEMGEKFPPAKIQHRYYNTLRPQQTELTDWTEEDTERLADIVKDYGTRWVWISETFFNNRAPNYLKNKYNNYKRKKTKEDILGAAQQLLNSLLDHPNLNDYIDIDL